MREGIALAVLMVAAVGLLAAAEPGGRRFALVPGTTFESAQFMFKIDEQTGRTWWTVVGPSKTTGKMFVATWNPIPDAVEATVPEPATADTLVADPAAGVRDADVPEASDAEGTLVEPDMREPAPMIEQPASDKPATTQAPISD